MMSRATEATNASEETAWERMCVKTTPNKTRSAVDWAFCTEKISKKKRCAVVFFLLRCRQPHHRVVRRRIILPQHRSAGYFLNLSALNPLLSASFFAPPPRHTAMVKVQGAPFLKSKGYHSDLCVSFSSGGSGLVSRSLTTLSWLGPPTSKKRERCRTRKFSVLFLL